MNIRKSLCALVLIVFSSFFIFSQEKSKSKFEVIAFGGIGFGVVDTKSGVNYNLNINGGEVLLAYNFSEKYGIASGIGYNILIGDGFSGTELFYLKRELLKIPVLFTITHKISDDIEFFGSLGFNTQYLIKEEYRFISGSDKSNVFEGWNFGAQAGAAFLFKINKSMKLGFTFNFQSDISRFDQDGSFQDQKVKNLSSIGLILKHKL